MTNCAELGEYPDRLDWLRASTVLFCFYHAVELFLKACILRQAPGEKLRCLGDKEGRHPKSIWFFGPACRSRYTG